MSGVALLACECHGTPSSDDEFTDGYELRYGIPLLRSYHATPSCKVQDLFEWLDPSETSSPYTSLRREGGKAGSNYFSPNDRMKTEVLAPQDLTRFLIDWRNGNRTALDEMTPALYEELRRLARHFLAAERPDHTLQPTALVHEAYLRLINQEKVDWRNRAHFLAIAATMMRRILVNYAEARETQKRGGNTRVVTIADVPSNSETPEVDLVVLNRSLDDLGKLDPQQSKVVELRFFGGLTIEETAEVMNLSPATVKREWTTARLWLMRHMGSEPQS